MPIQALTSFNYDSSQNKADFKEKVGNIGLGLLRIGLGKNVEISTIDNKTNFVTQNRSTAEKVSAIAIFIIVAPVTLPLALIGIIATKTSKTHKNITDLYKQSKSPIETAEKSTQSATIAANGNDASIGVNNDTNSEAAKPRPRARSFINDDQYKNYMDRKIDLPKNQELYDSLTTDQAVNEMPRAAAGNTPVYFPQQAPKLILKEAGRNCVARFNKMQKVHRVLASQRSTHLVVPKARIHKDFIIEKRLPIDTNPYRNMELYSQNPEQFDDAVRELTRLFGRVAIHDLIDTRVDSLGNKSDVGGIVRYDNLPLFIVEKDGVKQGKIGLIDIDIQGAPSPQAFNVLARIFPYHLDIIEEEALQYPDGKVNVEQLRANAADGKKYIEGGFSEHHNWLVEKNITAENCTQPLEITPERNQEITEQVEKELLRLNEGFNDILIRKGYTDIPAKNFLDDPENKAKELAAAITPVIIGNLQRQLERRAKPPKEPITDAKIVELRSPKFQGFSLQDGIGETIASQNVEVSGMQMIPEQLVYIVMQELTKGKEIFYYETSSSQADPCCVRY